VQYSIAPLHHLREHREPVDAIAWSPDGNTLITGADKSLYMWDPKVRKEHNSVLSGLMG
jgi:WD40 repeat protein